jgi:predicted outer membrane repeat protein
MSPTGVNLTALTPSATATATFSFPIITGTYSLNFAGQSGGAVRSTTATLTVK